MKQTPDDERLSQDEPEIVPQPEPIDRLDLGAEPFWMQDVRCAQRRIEAHRANLRPADSGGDSAKL